MVKGGLTMNVTNAIKSVKIGLFVIYKIYNFNSSFNTPMISSFPVVSWGTLIIDTVCMAVVTALFKT